MTNHYHSYSMASEANNNTALRYVCFVRFVQKEWQTSTHKLNVSQHIEKNASSCQ